MKNKILVFFLTICFILPCTFIFSACDKPDDGITECAYVRFVPAGDEVVQYTSYMYNIYTHIYLFENEESRDAGWDDNYLLKISFNRNLGVDDSIDGKDALCVAIKNLSSMEIMIKKDYFDSSKKVYLNGQDITSKADSTLSKPPEEESTGLGTVWHDAVYYFENFGLIQGNSSNYINTIEYK